MLLFFKKTKRHRKKNFSNAIFCLGIDFLELIFEYECERFKVVLWKSSL